MVFEGVLEGLSQYSDVLLAIFLLALTLVITGTIFFIFKHHVLRLKIKESSLDEKIGKEARTPFYLAASLIGGYYALKSLNIFAPYRPLIKDIFVLLLVLLSIYVSRRIINTTIKWYANKERRRLKIEKTALMSLGTFFNIFIMVIALIIVLAQFGVEITPLLASLGIGGLAIAFALQSTISNYFSGVYMATDKTVRIGDYIELDNEKKGYVERMTWRTVWIKTLAGNMVVIPNSRLSDSILINYSQPRGERGFVIDWGVAYDSDLKKVEKVSLKVARHVSKTVDGAVPDFEPLFRFKNFGDSNINCYIVLRVKDYVGKFLVRHEFVKQLKEEFDKEGIEISFPCRNVYMRNT